MNKILTLLAVLLIAYSCTQGPAGDDGSNGEMGMVGPPGPSGETGMEGASGNPGENGSNGEMGSNGANADPCTAEDNGDGTYTLICPDSDPITLDNSDDLDKITGTYFIAGEVAVAHIMYLNVILPDGKFVNLATTVTDELGQFSFEFFAEELLVAGRIYISSTNDDGAFLGSRSVMVDGVSRVISEMLLPFYTEAISESQRFTAEAIQSLDSSAREAAEDAMDRDAAVRATLQAELPALLQGEIIGSFVASHPFIYTSEHPLVPVTHDNLDDLDIDYTIDEDNVDGVDRLNIITEDEGLWDLEEGGRVNDGGDDAYDDAMELSVKISETSSLERFDVSLSQARIQGYRYLELSGDMDLSSGSDGASVTIGVTRQLLINHRDKSGGHWLRYTDTFSNPSAEPINIDINYYTEIDSSNAYGPRGDDWHTSVDNELRENTLGFYYPDIDQIEFENPRDEILMTARREIAPGGSISLRTWLFKSVRRGSQTLDGIAAEIEAVIDGSDALATLPLSKQTSVKGMIGSVGPGVTVEAQLEMSRVLINADHLGRFHFKLDSSLDEVSLSIGDASPVVIEIPDEDQCAVANGYCGDDAYATCSNQIYDDPICVDQDACLVDNGGCGAIATVTCVDQYLVAPQCVDVSECAVNNGGCEDLLCVERFANASNDCVDIEPGIQTNVAMDTFIQAGFSLCHQSIYNQSGLNLDEIIAGCVGDELLMACRPIDNDFFTLAAIGLTNDIFFDVGTGEEAMNESNGVAFYYNQNSSMGFAPLGESLRRDSCDTSDAGPDNGSLRMCWHTLDGNLSSGYRCGTVYPNNSWERILMVR